MLSSYMPWQNLQTLRQCGPGGLSFFNVDNI